MVAASITPRDRLSFTLFLAVSLHAAIILGVSFAAEDSAPPAATIEVTLAQYADAEAPEDADFIAQSNQQGSGTEAEALETTTTNETDFQTDQIQSITPDPVPVMTPEPQLKRELLSTVTSAEDQVTAEEVVPRWTIRGVSPHVREKALKAPDARGMTVGDWVAEAIILTIKRSEGSNDAKASNLPATEAPPDLTKLIAGLNERLMRLEARENRSFLDRLLNIVHRAPAHDQGRDPAPSRSIS
jgi:hypothetical protein